MRPQSLRNSPVVAIAKLPSKSPSGAASQVRPRAGRWGPGATYARPAGTPTHRSALGNFGDQHRHTHGDRIPPELAGAIAPFGGLVALRMLSPPNQNCGQTLNAPCHGPLRTNRAAPMSTMAAIPSRLLLLAGCADLMARRVCRRRLMTYFLSGAFLSMIAN